MKKFNYNIKILKEEEVEWNSHIPGACDAAFFKKQHFFEHFKIHEFNNLYINQTDIWQWSRNLKDTILEIKKFESKSFDQSEKVHVERAMLFVNSGDDHSWQHWMQDALHLLCQSANFLKNNEDITLLFPFHGDHVIFCVKELCKLKNKIQHFDPSFPHRIKKLYVPARLPHSLFYKKTVPPDNIKYIRKLLTPILIGYFAIGSILSFPMALSYVYAQWFVLINMGWSVFSFSGLGFIMMSGYLIVFSPMIRAVLWLPSLIMWFNDPGAYSFMMWLAPGFYVSTG